MKSVKERNNLKYIIFTIISYFFLLLAFRTLLPAGKEPDFVYRIFQLKNIFSGNELINNAYFEYVNLYKQCSTSFTPKSLFGMINAKLCTEDISLLISRYFLQSIPFILFITAYLLRLKIGWYKNTLKIESLLLSFIFPSIIYYLGLLSIESLAVLISTLLIFCIDSKRLVLLIILLILPIEIGLVGLIILFFLIRSTYIYLNEKFGMKTVDLTFIFSLIFTFTVGFDLIKILFFIPLFGQKLEIIYIAYTETSYAEVMNKYPVILRPIISFMTGVFMTPDGVKSVVIYFIHSYCLFFLFVKTIKNRRKFENKIVYLDLISVFTLVICIAFIFPAYTNFKYFVFTFPFLTHAAIKIYSFKKVFCVYLLSSVILIFNLFLYMI